MRATLALWVAVAFGFGSAALGAGAPPPAAPPAPAAPPPAAKGADAPKPAEAAKSEDARKEEDRKAEEARREALSRKVREQSERWLVLVTVELQKDQHRLTEQPADRVVEMFVEEKRPMERPGVLLGRDGRVAMPDLDLRDIHYKKITVRLPGGETVPAKRLGIVEGTPAMMLKIDPPAGKAVPEGADFGPAPKLNPAIRLAGMGLAQVDGRWTCVSGSLGPVGTVPAEGGSPARAFVAANVGSSRSRLGRLARMNPMYLREMGALMPMDDSSPPFLLLFDADARPVGLAFEDRLALDGGGAVWLGGDFLKSPVLSPEAILAKEEKARKRLAEVCPELKIEFWQEGEDGERMEDAESEKEWKGFGLAVSEKDIFLPGDLSRQAVAQIERVRATVGGKTLEAEFAGVFKDFGGTLLRVKDGKLPAFLPLKKDAQPPEFLPFYSVEVERRLEKLDLVFTLNRILSWGRGYKNRLVQEPSRAVGLGEYLLSLDGDVLGFFLREKREGEEEKGAAGGRGGYGRMSSVRIYSAGEIAEALANPAKSFDPHRRPKAKQEARRPAWLGVEYSGLGNTLAKALGCLKETKDGSMGLLVTLVYEGSPAHRLGIVEGDILLRLWKEGEDDPIELRPGYEYRGWRGGMSARLDTGDIPHEFRIPILPRPQENYINGILKAIGEGKKVKLEVLHAGKVEKKEFAVEKAEPTFSSSPKYKNEAVGITVKNLTYEVRHILRLKKEEPGVIVSKIEPGTAAAICRILPFEVITRVDDDTVSTVEEFQKALESRQKSKVPQVKIVVRRLDQSRIIDMGLQKIEKREGAMPPPGDGDAPAPPPPGPLEEPPAP